MTVYIHDESKQIELDGDVADVAEVTPGRLMVAYLDGNQEMHDGWIFGAKGRWKIWHESGDETDVFVASDPLTHPGAIAKFTEERADYDVPHARKGRIRRLKRADL